MKPMLLALVVLAGCATREQRREEAMSEPPMTVCYYAMAANTQLAREESVRAVYLRGIDCAPYVPMIAAQMQANQAQLMQGLLLLQAGRPKAQPMPAQTNCRSVVNGNTIQTVCN